MNNNDGRFYMHSSSLSLSGAIRRGSTSVSSDSASAADTGEDPSSSSSSSSSSSCCCCNSSDSSDGANCLLQLTEIHTNAYAMQAIHAAAALVQQRSSRSDVPLVQEKLLAALGTTTQKNAVERAIDLVWQLGLEFPDSGLVPEDDSGRIRLLQFLYTWATRVVPALHLQPSESPARAYDLATLSSWIALQRRCYAKSKGPFWNGRMPGAAEVVVAPFADLLLHSDAIPDSQEYGSLAAWLAALRALPQPAGTLV